MNVIFLDFDGVLYTVHNESKEMVEERIRILSKFCIEYNCKVVISASIKEAIDEDTMHTYNDSIKFIFDCFKKYNIDCIGRTPSIVRKVNDCSYISIWKEDEIRLYLFRHPEIDHYVVIDDDDMYPYNSDLNKVRNHLVKTIYCSKNPDEEGLLEKHMYDVGRTLKEDNEIKKLILRRKNT